MQYNKTFMAAGLLGYFSALLMVSLLLYAVVIRSTIVWMLSFQETASHIYR